MTRASSTLAPSTTLAPSDRDPVPLPPRPGTCKCCATHNPHPAVTYPIVAGGATITVCPSARDSILAVLDVAAALGRFPTNTVLRATFGFLPSAYIRAQARAIYA